MEAVRISEMVMRTARKNNCAMAEFVCSKRKKVTKAVPKNKQRPMKSGKAFDTLALKRSVWFMSWDFWGSTWKCFASTPRFTSTSTSKPIAIKNRIQKKIIIAPCDVPKGHKEIKTLYRSGSRLGIPVQSFWSWFSD